MPPSGPFFARNCSHSSVVGCVGGCELDHILLRPVPVPASLRHREKAVAVGFAPWNSFSSCSI
eukprot:14518362-Heterocapsa_arctica.AAC.1